MRLSFRSFALRWQRVIRRCLRKLAKHLRSASLWYFFVNALCWVERAWAALVQWYAPPPRKRRKKAQRKAPSLGFVILCGESLEARRCLSNLYWDGNTSAAFVSQNWYVGTPGQGSLVAWSNTDNSGNRNIAYVQGSSGPIDLTIGKSDNVSPASIYFGYAGSATSFQVSGGAITLSQDISVYAKPGVSSTITSAIVGGNYQLIIPDTGTLALTGSVTVAGIQETAGTLALNGTTTITNADSSGYGLWVENDATIQGNGPLMLENLAGQMPPTPFDYDSSSLTSFYNGPISGPGQVEVPGGGELRLGSAANDYRGGTNVGTGASPAF